MEDFKNLKVWQKAHALALRVYQETKTFPKDEMYGLTSQMRRAAVSIGANIAEGSGRRSDGEFVRFLQIARGSAAELEQHLLLSRDLKILTAESHNVLEAQLLEIQRMMASLVSAIENRGTKIAKSGSSS